MDADMIVKLLLPALFFAAWALNQIVNREPSGGARAGGGVGNGAGGMAGRNPLGPRPVPPGGIEEALRGPGGYDAERARMEAELRGAGSGRGVPMPGSEEIVILQTQTDRARAASQARRQPAKRGRGSGAGSGGGEKAAGRKPVGPAVGGLGESRLQPMKVRPLSESTAELAARPSGAGAVVGIGVVLPPDAGEIRQQLLDPGKVREALLLSEVLARPVALRGGKGIVGGGMMARGGGSGAADGDARTE